MSLKRLVLHVVCNERLAKIKDEMNLLHEWIEFYYFFRLLLEMHNFDYFHSINHNNMLFSTNESITANINVILPPDTESKYCFLRDCPSFAKLWFVSNDVHFLYQPITAAYGAITSIGKKIWSASSVSDPNIQPLWNFYVKKSTLSMVYNTYKLKKWTTTTNPQTRFPPPPPPPSVQLPSNYLSNDDDDDDDVFYKCVDKLSQTNHEWNDYLHRYSKELYLEYKDLKMSYESIRHSLWCWIHLKDFREVVGTSVHFGPNITRNDESTCFLNVRFLYHNFDDSNECFDTLHKKMLIVNICSTCLFKYDQSFTESDERCYCYPVKKFHILPLHNFPCGSIDTRAYKNSFLLSSSTEVDLYLVRYQKNCELAYVALGYNIWSCKSIDHPTATFAKFMNLVKTALLKHNRPYKDSF